MALSTVIEVAGLSVEINELTVSEIRSWLVHAETESNDIVGNLLIDDCPLDTIVTMSSITKKQISQLTPSEIEKLKEGCQKINSHFFELIAGLLT